MTAPVPGPEPLLSVRGLQVHYGHRPALQGIDIEFAPGEVTAIIGPNGSGKSTLLRALGRLQRPSAGNVTFDGHDLWNVPPREFARRVAFLPQAPIAPPDLLVEDLAWRGRYPHRGLFGAAGDEDRRAVAEAIRLAGMEPLRGRPLGTLSGGERQRAWIALALAQQPDVLLLDEPTTFLDIGHAIDLLALLRRLNAEQGLTVLMVMHEVGLVSHYARRVVALRAGALLADGPPADVITAERLSALFGARVTVLTDPASGAPIVIPAAGLTGALDAPVSSNDGTPGG